MKRIVQFTAPMSGILMLMLTVFSCKKKIVEAPVAVTDTTQTYFSIKGFLKDQVILLSGQPYSLNEFITRDGKTDSDMVNFYTMDLGYVLKTFIATDISNPEFLGKYRFSNFEEASTGNRTLMYEAKEPDLFTRTFSFSVDPTNDRILSLYVETSKKVSGGHLHQRLLYIPLKTIQIQEDEGATFSKTRNLRVEYRFLQ